MPETQPTPDQYIEPPPAGWGGMGGPVGTPSDAFGLQPPMRPPAAPKSQPAPTGPPDEVIQPQGGAQLPITQVSATAPAASPLRDQIKQMWVEAGATPEAAEGILRRVQVESGFNPLAMGDYRDGKPSSFGLYQHHEDRAKALYAFATKQGKSPSDPLVQTEFAIHEAKNGGDPTATANWDKIKSDPTGSAFTQYFERPRGVGLKAWSTSESPELKARGEALIAEADRIRDQHVAGIADLMRQANAAPAGSKARDDAIAEVREREHRYSLEYERLSMHPPPMKPVDAMANFGSAGTIIALIGGLFARRHMTAALGAAGKAMQAINQNNFDQYQREYRVWEQQSKSALDMVKIQHDELRELIDDKKLAFDEKNTRIRTALEAMGMDRQAQAMALGEHEKVYTEVAGLEKAHTAAAQSKLAFQMSVAGQLEAKYIADGMNPAEAKSRAYKEAGILPQATPAKVQEAKVEEEAARLNTAWDAAHPGASATEKAEAHHKNDLAARTEMALATAKSPTGQLSEDSVKLLARQYEMGDTAVITSLPRGGPGRIQVENQIAADMKDMPDGAAQVVMNRLRMAEAKAAATTAGRITMNTEVYSKEAAGAGQQVIETSKKFPRTNYPKINEAIEAYNLHTGDPNIIAFGAAMSAFINAYGKLSNPTGIGVHDADKERITKILDTRLSQGQIEAGVEQVIKEGIVVSTAARQAQEEVLGHIMPHQPGTAPPPAAPAPPPSPAPAATAPPVPNARKAPDGHWYVPPSTPGGKYLRVDP